MQHTLYYLALGIGYSAITVICILVILAIFWGGTDILRAHFPRLDLWLYDENKRWNDKQRRKLKSEGSHDTVRGNNKVDKP